jgi:hypothetical protein
MRKISRCSGILAFILAFLGAVSSYSFKEDIRAYQLISATEAEPAKCQARKHDCGNGVVACEIMIVVDSDIKFITLREGTDFDTQCGQALLRPE